MKEVDYDYQFEEPPLWGEGVADELEILDTFLFEDIDNNQNFSEDTHGISWKGNNFVIYEYATGKTTNIQVAFVPGYLTKEEIEQIKKDQEWD